MRKMIFAAAALLLLSVAYAENMPKGICTEYESTFDEFSFTVMWEFPFVDYVAYSVYDDWSGDAEAFIQWLKDNPTDLDEDDFLDSSVL